MLSHIWCEISLIERPFYPINWHRVHMEHNSLPRVKREIKQCKKLNDLRKRGRLIVDPNTLGMCFFRIRVTALLAVLLLHLSRTAYSM